MTKYLITGTQLFLLKSDHIRDSEKKMVIEKIIKEQEDDRAELRKAVIEALNKYVDEHTKSRWGVSKEVLGHVKGMKEVLELLKGGKG